MDAIKCGNFIALRRKELNMTQADLAKKLNVTDKAVSRWERGLGLPDINSLEDLALALDISIYELIKSEKSNNKIEALDDSIKEVVNLANNQRKSYEKKLINLLIIGLLIVTIIISLAYIITTKFNGFWLVFGLLAFVIAIINLVRVIFISNKYCSLFVLASMTMALLTIFDEYKLVALWVERQDYSALLDVVPYMPNLLKVPLFVGFTLNLLAVVIAEFKYKK